jgi:hypothetical protein
MSLTLVLTAACRDAAAPQPEGMTPAFIGASVERGPAQFWARVSDNGWSVYVGATAAELAEDCLTGSTENFSASWEELTVERSSGGVHFRDKGRDLPVIVYQEPFYEVCFATAPVFASGTSTVTLTDNDFFLDAPGADSFGMTGSGIVTTPAGARYRLQYHFRTVVDPDNSSFTERASVKMTPVK